MKNWPIKRWMTLPFIARSQILCKLQTSASIIYSTAMRKRDLAQAGLTLGCLEEDAVLPPWHSAALLRNPQKVLCQSSMVRALCRSRAGGGSARDQTFSIIVIPRLTIWIFTWKSNWELMLFATTHSHMRILLLWNTGLFVKMMGRWGTWTGGA